MRLSSEKIKRSSSLATAIRQVRKYHRLSQEKFAQVLGISTPSIYNYEAGKTRPIPLVLSRILNMAPESLVEPLRTEVMPNLLELTEEVHKRRDDADSSSNQRIILLLKRELAEKERIIAEQKSRHPGAGKIRRSRYSEETRQQLLAAVEAILDNAPSAVVEDVSAYLTRRAGQYGASRDQAVSRPARAGKIARKKTS